MERKSDNKLCCKQEGGGFGNQFFLLFFFFFVLVGGIITAIVINVNNMNYVEEEIQLYRNVTSGNKSALIPVLSDNNLDEFGCAQSNMQFNLGQYRVLKHIGIVTASLSLVGSSFIILTWILFRNLRTFPFKLIVFLSASDFFASIAYLFSVNESMKNCNQQEYCSIIGFCLHFFLCASFMWIFAISINLNLLLVQRVGNDILKYEKYYHLLTWGTCIILSVVPLFFDGYGDAGNYCWIKMENEIYLATFVYHIPLLLVMIMSSINFLVSSISVKAGRDRKTTGETVRIKIRLTMYIVVFVLFHFFEITKKIHMLADSQNPSYGLYFLARLFTPLNGLGNAVAYGLNRAVVNTYRKACCGNFTRGSSSNDRSANMIKADDVENRDGFSNITTTTTEGGEGGNLDDDNINKKGRNSWIKR